MVLMIQRRTLLGDYRLNEREDKNFRLLELMRQRGALTRTQLSQGTGFNIVTVANYVADFIAHGLVVERGFDVSTGGRKPILIELNPKAAFVIGVDLGLMGSSVPVTMTGFITDLRGTIVHRIVKPRIPDGMDSVLLSGGEMIYELLKTSPVDPKKIQGAAIGMGGVLDERAGTVRDTSNRGTRTSYSELQSRWEHDFKIPVFICNDASLAGYGEYRLGGERAVEHMVYLYSDVGASLILHGQVYWGASGSAGEVGIRVPSGDDYLAWVQSAGLLTSSHWDLGLAAQARKLVAEGAATTVAEMAKGHPEAISMDTVIDAALSGDAVAQDLVRHSALQLGIRVASVVNLLNPELIVIGGGIERAGSMLLEPVWRAVRKYAYEEAADIVDIVPAQLGPNAVALGGACWVIREIFVQA